MPQLSKLFLDTWKDFKKLYLKKMRCQQTEDDREEGIQPYGWFWNEFDVRFHFSKLFYDKLDPRKVWFFTEYLFSPEDWGNPGDKMHDKMQAVLDKLGVKEYPKVDIAVYRPGREDVWAEICAEFKFINVVRKLTPQQLESRLERIATDFRRLDSIKSKGLVKDSFMCIVDEYFYWERNHSWRERFQQLERKYTRAKLLHFKVPKKEIEFANAQGIR